MLVFLESGSIAMVVLALIAKLGVGSGWVATMVLTSETYPTVIR